MRHFDIHTGFGEEMHSLLLLTTNHRRFYNLGDWAQAAPSDLLLVILNNSEFLVTTLTDRFSAFEKLGLSLEQALL